MASYEEQLIKWAAHRYKIPRHTIDEVTLDVEAYTGYGCPTCGPETTKECDILVFGLPDSRQKRKVLKSESIELDWSKNFASILKEIIEA